MTTANGKTWRRTGIAALAVAGVLSWMATDASARSQAVRNVNIGTGGVTGVYYPAGGAVCRLVNKGRNHHGIRCAVESTGGSVANIDGLRDGDLTFGIAQTDAQFAALNAEGAFADKSPYKDLRSVFSLHAEMFTLVARAAAGIDSLDDLKGKRVNIGNPGSGQRSTMEAVMSAKGWTAADFSEATELTSAEQSRALCDDRIDAMAFTVGHPNASIKEATVTCPSKLVHVSGPDIDALVAAKPYYFSGTIPGDMYQGTDKDVQTFGIRATLLTSTHTSEETVYEVVKSVFERFDQFRKMHSVFGRLDIKRMSSEGLIAPLHPGAERYFKEAGLID